VYATYILNNIHHYRKIEYVLKKRDMEKETQIMDVKGNRGV
jgi:hypothetical protein